MLMMVIEQFKDVDGLRERFQKQGRMLPDDVIYHASWIDAATDRCYQVMEAATVESLQPWIDCWSDLVEFEVIPVLTSQEYWATK
jgi:hypothetical protein